MSVGADAGEFPPHTWWHFSTQFVTQFLAVMGFATSQPARRTSSFTGTSAHAFHYRWEAGMKYDFVPAGYVGYHSERSERISD